MCPIIGSQSLATKILHLELQVQAHIRNTRSFTGQTTQSYLNFTTARASAIQKLQQQPQGEWHQFGQTSAPPHQDRPWGKWKWIGCQVHGIFAQMSHWIWVAGITFSVDRHGSRHWPAIAIHIFCYDAMRVLFTWVAPSVVNKLPCMSQGLVKRKSITRRYAAHNITIRLHKKRPNQPFPISLTSGNPLLGCIHLHIAIKMNTKIFSMLICVECLHMYLRSTFLRCHPNPAITVQGNILRSMQRRASGHASKFFLQGCLHGKWSLATKVHNDHNISNGQRANTYILKQSLPIDALAIRILKAAHTNHRSLQ